MQSIVFAMLLIFSCRSIYYCVWGSVDWKFNERMRCGLYVVQQSGGFLTICYQCHLGDISFECWLTSLISYITLGIGLTIYAIKYPEVVWPGKFDLYFNSHQIMHFMVLIGVVLVRNFYDCIRDSQKNGINNVHYTS